MMRRNYVLAAAVIAVTAVPALSLSPAQAGLTTRVSVASDATQANGPTGRPSISADGRYVAFHASSQTTNLVAGDTNGAGDVFVHDRQTGQTTRVSVASDGTQGNANSEWPRISADGRYVVFHSQATNLVAGDTNGMLDVFVHDRQTGQTSRVSVASGGGQGSSHSAFPCVSGDGRYVAFHSQAFNLVPGDTNGAWDVFVHDRQTGQTSRVSVASGGTQGNDDSQWSSISEDGRYVAFDSFADNLVPGDTNKARDIFAHDRQTGQTTRVSVGSEGTQANSHCGDPWISGDGRYVAFSSSHTTTNLVPGDTNGYMDVVVHDRQTGQTTRVSVASDGTQGNEDSWDSSIGTEGRYVAFESDANTLVPGDTNGRADIFVHDRQTGQTARVSVASDGTQGNHVSEHPAISGDERYVTFASYADTLVAGDTNGVEDVFVHDRWANGPPPVIMCPDPGPYSVGGDCTAPCPAASATDDVDPNPTVTQDPAAGTPLGPGGYVIAVTACDGGGNCAVAECPISVVDDTAPEVQCPPDVTTCNHAGVCEATVDIGTATATDNCEVASISHGAPATFPVGTTVVTWSACDAAGNCSPCEQNITVEDCEAPTISCPSDVTAVSPHCLPIAVDIGVATASDNCGVASMTNDAPALMPPGVTVVTWTACDEAANCASCTHTVTVQCPPTCDITHQPASPLAGESIAFDAGASDPDGGTIVSIEWDFGDGGTTTGPNPTHAYAYAGCFQIRLIVTDSDGLSTTCIAAMTIRSETEVPLCKAGWHMIAQPHSGDHALAEIFVRDDRPPRPPDPPVIAFCDAVGSWVMNPLFYYDIELMAYGSCGCAGQPPPTPDHTLRMGHGYWLYTFQDYLTLVFP